MLSPHFVDSAGEVVRRRTGLAFPETRRPALVAGLCAALSHARLTEPDDYLARLETESELLDDLVGEITVGETYFFREPEQFTVIRDEILPVLLAASSGRPLRMWSAGCATGEEPSTLAMVVREQGLAATAHIVASDLSRNALAVARKGVYGQWSLRGVPEQVTEMYFTRVRDRFELAAAVRDAVEYRYLNLAEDAYPSLATGIWGMDLILCRNVLIYFDAQTVARVARRLVDSLSEDGWLLLGASDPALDEYVSCDVVVTRSGLAYRRPRRGGARSRPGADSVVALPLAPPPRLDQSPAGQQPRPHAQPAITATAESPLPADSVDEAEPARCYAARDYERAAAAAARLLQSAPGDEALWVVLVRALANRGDLAAAGSACAAALDRHPAATELIYLHAVLLAEAGRHRESADAAGRALYLDREFVVAHFALGGALGRLGDVPGARRAFRNAAQLLARVPSDATVAAADGEPAGRLAEMARVQLQLLDGMGRGGRE